MAIPQVVTLGPSVGAANAALYAASQTPVSGTPLTLTGARPAVARPVLLTYGSEAAARSMVITGTNASGSMVVITLAVPSGSAGTVATSEPLTSVTSVVPLGGGWTAAVTLGTNAVVSSGWNIVDTYIAPPGFTWAVNVTGTANWSVDITYDNPNSNASNIGGALGNPAVPPVPSSALGTNPVPTSLLAQAASNTGIYNGAIYAWRLVLNSGGTGANDTVRATMTQAGLPMR